MASPRRSSELVELDGVLLARAQAGDEHAFRSLVDRHRPEIQAHCYRMLGSFHDAEDAYQDTLLRAWRALDGFDERSRLSTWLYRIATNVCLTALRRRSSRRVLPADLASGTFDNGGGEGTAALNARWIEPFADPQAEIRAGREDPASRYELRESIELAFVAALQHLPARQRAVLILSEVLGFRASEIADTLHTTVPAVHSALQRARARLEMIRPVVSQQRAIRELGGSRAAELVVRFAEAMERGDVSGLIELLATDVVFEMPPRPQWVAGRDQVAESWLVPTKRPTGLHAVPLRVNAQLAVAVYQDADQTPNSRLIAVDVLTVTDTTISRITAFRSPVVLAALGVPTLRPR